MSPRHTPKSYKWQEIRKAPDTFNFVGYRPKGVFGKGVGNTQNASEMRQKCVKNASEMRQNGSCFIGKRGTSKMRQKSVKIASKMRQKSAEHLSGRTPLDDTDF